MKFKIKLLISILSIIFCENTFSQIVGIKLLSRKEDSTQILILSEQTVLGEKSQDQSVALYNFLKQINTPTEYIFEDPNIEVKKRYDSNLFDCVYKNKKFEKNFEKFSVLGSIYFIRFLNFYSILHGSLIPQIKFTQADIRDFYYLQENASYVQIIASNVDDLTSIDKKIGLYQYKIAIFMKFLESIKNLEPLKERLKKLKNEASLKFLSQAIETFLKETESIGKFCKVTMPNLSTMPSKNRLKLLEGMSLKGSQLGNILTAIGYSIAVSESLEKNYKQVILHVDSTVAEIVINFLKSIGFIERSLISNTVTENPSHTQTQFSSTASESQSMGAISSQTCNIVKACNNCSKKETLTEKLSLCKACRQVYYCSEKCQKEDWKKHEQHCRMSGKKLEKILSKIFKNENVNTLTTTEQSSVISPVTLSPDLSVSSEESDSTILNSTNNKAEPELSNSIMNTIESEIKARIGNSSIFENKWTKRILIAVAAVGISAYLIYKIKQPKEEHKA